MRKFHLNFERTSRLLRLHFLSIGLKTCNVYAEVQAKPIETFKFFPPLSASCVYLLHEVLISLVLVIFLGEIPFIIFHVYGYVLEFSLGFCSVMFQNSG